MKFVRLGDVCEKIGSGATPRGGSEVYRSNGIALIRSQNIYNDGFKRDGLAFITDKHAEELENVTVHRSDVLLNITGDSVARVCQVPDEILPARVNQHVTIIRPYKDVLDSRYLRYFLVSPPMQQHMLALAAAGATRNALTKGMIEKFEVPCPLLSEQRAIAHILGTLDDKIELNRRMNETLEAMARAIFKSWFVNFDPVRAKLALSEANGLEGRQPAGMDAETAALFPNSFEDSPLGKIPKGWQVKPLGDALSVLETGWRPKGGVKDITEGVPSVGAESIVGLGRYDYGKAKYVPREFFDSMNRGHVVDRDVLLYKDGGRPGEFEPHVSIFGDSFPFGEFCINEHVYRLRTTDALSQAYLYFWLESDVIMDEMRNRGTGVAVPGLNSTALRSIPVLIPSATVMPSFTKAVDTLISRIFANCNENRSLATIRDALLPKLLSGEVRVKDAEQFAEANT